MTGRALAIVLPLIAASCVSAAPPATEQEQASSIRANTVCEHEAARRLDDGISDARTVARAVRSACATERLAAEKTFLRGAPSPELESRMLDITTKTVLQQRNRR